jgi:hypothetical protein
VGLPYGVGGVTGTLLAETNSAPTRAADIVIAYRCLSGLALGIWMDRLLSFPLCDPVLLFSTRQQRIWTSLYFRETFAWPLVEQQRLSSEPTRRGFSLLHGHRIRDKIYSMHSWRRGGHRSVVTRGYPAPIVRRSLSFLVVARPRPRNSWNTAAGDAVLEKARTCLLIIINWTSWIERPLQLFVCDAYDALLSSGFLVIVGGFVGLWLRHFVFWSLDDVVSDLGEDGDHDEGAKKG